VRRLGELTASGQTVPAKLPKDLIGYRDAAAKALEQAQASLSEDLNTPVALAALQELARIGNEVCDLASKRRKDKTFVAASTMAAQAVASAVRRVAAPLGLLQASLREYQARTSERRLRLRGLTVEQVYAKVDERNQARRNREFGRSDEIRDELAAWGIRLRDLPGGTDWTIDV